MVWLQWNDKNNFFLLERLTMKSLPRASALLFFEDLMPCMKYNFHFHNRKDRKTCQVSILIPPTILKRCAFYQFGGYCEVSSNTTQQEHKTSAVCSCVEPMDFSLCGGLCFGVYTFFEIKLSFLKVSQMENYMLRRMNLSSFLMVRKYDLSNTHVFLSCWNTGN